MAGTMISINKGIARTQTGVVPGKVDTGSPSHAGNGSGAGRKK